MKSLSGSWNEILSPQTNLFIVYTQGLRTQICQHALAFMENDFGHFSNTLAKSISQILFYSAFTLLLILVPGFTTALANGSPGFPKSELGDDQPPSVSSDGRLLPFVTNPNFTVRFANPQYNCTTEEYCVDVEFQSDIPDQQLFGMNVRFFYEDNLLEFIDFRDFQGGYGPVAPNPPTILTSPAAFGYNYFRFGSPGNGAADWVNGAVQLVDESQPPLYISTTDWTKLYQICFSIDDPAPDSTGYCPAIVWDLEQNPANGGYLSGDEGVVMTATTSTPGESTPAFEHVVQFNWEYTGSGAAPPYGQPVETDCTPFSCGMSITCPADVTVNCGGSILPPVTGTASAEDNCPGVPIITYADSLVNGTCGMQTKIFRRWTATDSCNNLASCIQIITLQELGSICGTVTNDLGQAVSGVAIQLMRDVNANQLVDAGDILITTTYTDSISGSYCFSMISPCAYVLREIQPAHYSDSLDVDQSPDPDGDDSGDNPDNEIPVNLSSCEADLDNNFIDIICPSEFPSLPLDTICGNGQVTFEIEDLNLGSLTYTWGFGSGSLPSTGTGIGPHVVSYESTPSNQNPGALVDLTISKSGCPDTTAQVSLITVNPWADATINGSATPGCYYTNRVFQPLQSEIPGATYLWNFGYHAIPASATGYGPHTVYYDTAGFKTVTLQVYPNAPGASCPDTSGLSFQINACPSQITGFVHDNSGNPITGVNIRLYADGDFNGLPDNNTVIRNVFTNTIGSFSMASLTPGNYVASQVQPQGWYSMDDGDMTEDNDVVNNPDTLDNLIPVTLTPSELDAANFYIEGPIAGSLSGSVFDDFDGDQMPDAGEGIANVTLVLYADVNTDGIADNNVPLYTQSSLPDGSFLFGTVPTGHYVLTESQPSGYSSVKDIDLSDDGDVVPNTNMTNDILPVTITNAEADEHNYFIDEPVCNLLVTNTNDDGNGSLRAVIGCAENGDTIRFHSSLEGMTILINSSRILVDKDLVIYSDWVPRITLASMVNGFFDVLAGHEVMFWQLDIVSGLAGNGGAAFKNEGTLKLHDVHIMCNPLLPVGEYLIRNYPASQLQMEGDCQLQED